MDGADEMGKGIRVQSSEFRKFRRAGAIFFS
jgi:hypothetical protein